MPAIICPLIVHFIFNMYAHSKTCLQMRKLRFRKIKLIPKSHKASSETCKTKNQAL